MNDVFPIIDAHQHYWRYDAALDGWIDPAGPIARDFAPGDVRAAMRRTGVDRAVAVQARSSEAETALLLAWAGRYDWIAGVVGWLDLAAPDLAARIARFRGRGPLVGLRHVVQAEPAGFLGDDGFVRGVRATLAAGLAYDILIRAPQLAELPRFLERVGEGVLVVDHGAKPPIAAAGWQPWADGIAVAARFPHVLCKLSGLVTEADHAGWRAAGIERYLDHLLASFGPERLIFGSDWPVCTLAASYEEVHATTREWAERRCPGAVGAIFGGTAARAYALNGGRA